MKSMYQGLFSALVCFSLGLLGVSGTCLANDGIDHDLSAQKIKSLNYLGALGPLNEMPRAMIAIEAGLDDADPLVRCAAVRALAQSESTQLRAETLNRLLRLACAKEKFEGHKQLKRWLRVVADNQ